MTGYTEYRIRFGSPPPGRDYLGPRRPGVTAPTKAPEIAEDELARAQAEGFSNATIEQREVGEWEPVE